MTHCITLGCGRPGVETIVRHAVKAVVVQSGRVLLMRSAAGGDLKFPGGGIEAGEDARTALARELIEECGRPLLDLSDPLVRIEQTRADQRQENTDFRMTSVYYRCTVGDQVHARQLDAYEQALALASVWVTAEEALAVNEALLGQPDVADWVHREAVVLRWLIHTGAL